MNTYFFCLKKKKSDIYIFTERVSCFAAVIANFLQVTALAFIPQVSPQLSPALLWLISQSKHSL